MTYGVLQTPFPVTDLERSNPGWQWHTWSASSAPPRRWQQGHGCLRHWVRWMCTHLPSLWPAWSSDRASCPSCNNDSDNTGTQHWHFVYDRNATNINIVKLCLSWGYAYNTLTTTVDYNQTVVFSSPCMSGCFTCVIFFFCFLPLSVTNMTTFINLLPLCVSYMFSNPLAIGLSLTERWVWGL